MEISSMKNVRIPFMVTTSEAEAIDEWRYRNKVPSRAEAMRQLIALGLVADTNPNSEVK